MPNENLDKYFLASIVESSQDSIITINFEMIITSWNKAAEQLYGYTASEAIGKNLTMLTLPEDFNEVLRKIDKIKHNKQVAIFQTEIVGKGENHMILEMVLSPVKDEEGNVIGVSTIARNVTEYKRAAKALRDKQNLQKLIEAQKDERKRIAREIHDHIGQQMTGLQLKINELLKRYKEDSELNNQITELQLIATQIDSEVDFLACQLRPSVLDDLGLVAALKNFINDWSLHFKISAEFAQIGLKGKDLLPEIEINLYRIVQETLNNIAKHAEANNVSVLLEQRDNKVTLIVEDDGVGFEPSEKAVLTGNDRGMGLLGMKERAELIGGTFEIETSVRRGTTIYVRVPAHFDEAKTSTLFP